MHGPKVHYNGAKLAEIAFYVAASIFNNECTCVLHIIQLLIIDVGPSSLKFHEKFHFQRISIASIKAQ